MSLDTATRADAENERDDPDPAASQRRRRAAGQFAIWAAASVAVVLAVTFLVDPGGEPRASEPAERPASVGNASAQGSTGWQVRTFATVRETAFEGPRSVAVRGCVSRACAAGPRPLGRFAASFVGAVRSDGSGLVERGRYAGRYLTWDVQNAFVLDTEPRAFGSTESLVPFATVFSDSPLLPVGTRVRLLDCGSGGGALAARTCARLQRSTVRIAGPTAGQARRVMWVYVGDDTGDVDEPSVLRDAVVRIG